MVIQNTETPAQRETAARRHRTTPTEALEFSAGRVRDVAALRGLGFSYREIAEHYGVTPQAVSIMLQRHRGRIKELSVHTEHWTLSTRAANTLGRLRVFTREEERAKNVVAELRGQRNCGEKTIGEIERWLAEGTEREVS